MISKIADALLLRVYYPVTAVVSFGPKQQVCSLILFDSLFGTEERVVARDAQWIVVIFSHPDDGRLLTEEEWLSVHRIQAQAGHIPLKVYVFGEEFGCMECCVEHTSRERMNVCI